MLTGRKVPGDLARQVELAALGRARQHDEQSLARVGVLNKDDLVDELALALTALAPERRDWRARSGLPADELRSLEAQYQHEQHQQPAPRRVGRRGAGDGRRDQL
jgi:hypothetical protein